MDATVVANEVNQIQNDVPRIVWAVMTVEDQGIGEEVTDGFPTTTNMDNKSTQKKHCLLQGMLYMY